MAGGDHGILEQETKRRARKGCAEKRRHRTERVIPVGVVLVQRPDVRHRLCRGIRRDVLGASAVLVGPDSGSGRLSAGLQHQDCSPVGARCHPAHGQIPPYCWAGAVCVHSFRRLCIEPRGLAYRSVLVLGGRGAHERPGTGGRGRGPVLDGMGPGKSLP